MLRASVASILSLVAVLGGQADAVSAGDCAAAPHECAVSQIEREEYSAAADTLRKVLARSPRDLKALNLLGIALTGDGRIDEANEHFRRALTIDSDFQPARKNLAVNEFNRGNTDEARRLFVRVLRRHPEDEVAHLHLGEIEHSNRRSAAALRHYEQSGARVMSSPVFMLHYASVLLDQTQTARAITVLDMLPEDDAASRFDAGVALGKAGAFADAARFFGAARSGYRDPYAAAYNQTLMLVEAGDHEAAIRVAEEAFRQGLKSAELYNLAARAYVAGKRIQQAYDALRMATRLEPSAEQHYLDLALICMDHENYDLGLEIVDIGLRFRPDAAALHLHRGVLLVMKGMIEQAEPAFDRARSLMPDSPAPPVALAMAWMQSGRTDRAVELLRTHAAGARTAVVPYMFAIALIRSGVDPADAGGLEAVEALQHAVRLDPALAGARGELGKILLKRGDVEGAIAELELAARLDPDNVPVAYSLAQAYRRVGKIDRAQELLARVSTLNAEERGDMPDRELQRIMVRIVRDGSAPGRNGPGNP